MPDATLFVRQWEGLVAQVRILGAHAPGGARRTPRNARRGDADGFHVVAHERRDRHRPGRDPEHLAELSARYRSAGVAKWGLWVDADHGLSGEAAAEQGMVLDSRPRAMVADLQALALDGDPPPHRAIHLASVGRINDLAYGFPEPRLARALDALPPVLTYAAPQSGQAASVAMAFDVDTDTGVWFVATAPDARRKGLASGILQRLLHDARARGQQTASLQASAAGAPIYERLGFSSVGTLDLYEERFR